jgi:hypothetical protein
VPQLVKKPCHIPGVAPVHFLLFGWRGGVIVRWHESCVHLSGSGPHRNVMPAIANTVPLIHWRTISWITASLPHVKRGMRSQRVRFMLSVLLTTEQDWFLSKHYLPAWIKTQILFYAFCFCVWLRQKIPSIQVSHAGHQQLFCSSSANCLTSGKSVTHRGVMPVSG